ncbi:MAG: PAS domain S-box protein [Firmicutes bacterium]|nr:PAS domain S-box protein [Bacillota bacterium]
MVDDNKCNNCKMKSSNKEIDNEEINSLVLKTILDSTSEGILVVSKHRKIIHANKPFKKMWKIPESIFKSKSDKKLLEYVKSQLIFPEKFISEVTKSYDSNGGYKDTIYFNDGRIFSLYSKPLIYDNKIKGRVWNFTDVTMDKRYKKALKDRILFQKKLLNTIPFPIYIKDNESKFIDCNNSYAIFLGIEKEKIIGKTNEELFPKKICNKYDKMDKKLRDNGGIQRYNYIVPHNDGTNHDVSFTNALFKDADGKCTGIVGVMTDISEQKRISKALYESQERYRRLSEDSPDAIVVHKKGKIVFVNREAVKLLGFNHAIDLHGKNVLDFLHENYHKKGIKLIERIHKYGESTPLVEQKIVRTDGEIIDVESKSTIFPYGGEIATQTVIRDITKRKKEEKLRRETEVKLNEAIEYNKLTTEFFANLSHEFRTPLNIILGAIQLIESTLHSSSYENSHNSALKHINIMKQNCYRLLRLINNMIDVTKLGSGFYNLNFKNYNIISIVEDITLSVADYIKHKDINFIFDTEVEELITAIDADAMERIILNLLSNSVKFTNPGDKISVNIKTDTNHVIIVVKDSGVGIPKEKIDIIFDRFRQVDKSLTRIHEGSGIGLSIVKSLVKLHDGNISVKSEENKGTKVIIKLPIKKVKHNKYDKDNSNKGRIERINIEFSDIYS